MPVSTVDWWIELLEDASITVFPDIEELRTTHPAAYAILKPRDITSLAIGTIRNDDTLIGFLGVDNPDPDMVAVITSFIRVVGYFASTFLERRDLLWKLNRLSYHDPLTGAFNRHALEQYYHNDTLSSLGVIYCDITGLKQINLEVLIQDADRVMYEDKQEYYQQHPAFDRRTATPHNAEALLAECSGGCTQVILKEFLGTAHHGDQSGRCTTGVL